MPRSDTKAYGDFLKPATWLAALQRNYANWQAKPATIQSASYGSPALNNRFGPGRALPLVADMSVAGSEKIAVNKYSAINILADNMDIYALRDFFFTSDEDGRRMVEINVWSGMQLAWIYMKGMQERDSGRVIFISSEVAFTPMAPMAYYSASKATHIDFRRGAQVYGRESPLKIHSMPEIGEYALISGMN